MAGPASKPPRSSYATGVLLGIAAYAMWGVFPLYWPLLEPASALEILAHRFLWSLVFLVLLLTVTRGWGRLREQLRRGRSVRLLGLAAVLVAVNWGTYIWAVNSGHVVEGSLGYFINPLVSVLLGVVVLRERLRPLQWTAFGVAAFAVAVLTLGYGRLPWIALVLAVSFGLYGLTKKLADVPAVESLTIETAYAFPVALGYLVWLEVTGAAAFGQVSWGNTVLLAMTGVVTALPLLAFGGAVIRVPLSMMGQLQYLTPVLQFAIGVAVFHEPMPPLRWAGFAIVWLALVIFSIDAWRHARAQSASRRLDELEVAEPL